MLCENAEWFDGHFFQAWFSWSASLVHHINQNLAFFKEQNRALSTSSSIADAHTQKNSNTSL